jgi:sRNA-binding carbon storage regulator CsrA
MLLLTLKKSEYVNIHHGLITIKVIDKDQIAIEAPKEIKIERVTGDFFRPRNNRQKSEHSGNANSVHENKEES